MKTLDQLCSLGQCIWTRLNLLAGELPQWKWNVTGQYTSLVSAWWDVVGPQQFPFAPQQEPDLV